MLVLLHCGSDHTWPEVRLLNGRVRHEFTVIYLPGSLLFLDDQVAVLFILEILFLVVAWENIGWVFLGDLGEVAPGACRAC